MSVSPGPLWRRDARERALVVSGVVDAVVLEDEAMGFIEVLDHLHKLDVVPRLYRGRRAALRGWNREELAKKGSHWIVAKCVPGWEAGRTRAAATWVERRARVARVDIRAATHGAELCA